MANESSGKIENKSSKDAEKPNDRSKSYLGRFGSMLKAYLRTLSWFRELSTNSDVNGNEEEVRPQEITTGMKSLLEWFGRTLIDFLTPSWYPESPLPSSDADPNDNEEEEEQQESFLEWFGWKLKDFLTPSWFRKSSSHSTNENVEEEEPKQTMMGVKSFHQWFGRRLIDFFIPSWNCASSGQSTNTDLNGNEEEEEPQETMMGVGVRDDDRTSQPLDPQIQRLLSELDEISVRVGRVEELDFVDLLLIAGFFSVKGLDDFFSSQSCTLTCGIRQGSVLGTHFFKLYSSPIGKLCKSCQADHDQYADDTKLMVPLSPKCFSR